MDKTDFIHIVLNGDIEAIYNWIIVTSLFYLFLTLAIMLDFFSGIAKARRLKISRTSTGFRKTINKALQYYTFLLFAVLFDLILSVWTNIPCVSIGITLFLLFIEGYSVWENIGVLEKKQYINRAKDLIQTSEDIVGVVDGLKKYIKNGDIGAVPQELEKIKKKIDDIIINNKEINDAPDK